MKYTSLKILCVLLIAALAVSTHFGIKEFALFNKYPLFFGGAIFALGILMIMWILHTPKDDDTYHGATQDNSEPIRIKSGASKTWKTQQLPSGALTTTEPPAIDTRVDPYEPYLLDTQIEKLRTGESELAVLDKSTHRDRHQPVEQNPENTANAWLEAHPLLSNSQLFDGMADQKVSNNPTQNEDVQRDQELANRPAPGTRPSFTPTPRLTYH